MKNTKSKIIKIIVSVILSIALAIAGYISLPNISNALSLAANNLAEGVGKITALVNSTPTEVHIYEHRGYEIYSDETPIETVTYKDAEGNTGIADIQSVINMWLHPDVPLSARYSISKDKYGWIDTLRFNTSIFCVEAKETFPSLDDRIWGGCHVGGDSNGLEGTEQPDYIEWEESLCCSGTTTIRTGSWKGAGVQSQTVDWSEAVFWGKIGAGVGNGTLANAEQYTVVNLQYVAKEKIFNVAESYIYSYSKRNYFKDNPAQLAIWMYRGQPGGSTDEALALCRGALAVQELSNPIKPTMSAITDETVVKSTGTVIDGDDYKVGPIYMNQYTYGYSENVKTFSGDASLESKENADLLSRMDETEKEFYRGLIAGIVEAKVELDSGEIIYLDGDNFSYSDTGDTTSGSEYYSCPTASDGYEYPTPNSKFYITIPMSDCIGASKIVKVTMTYKWTDAEGHGGVLTGTYDILKFSTGGQAISENKGCSYNCGNTEGNGTCVHTVPHDERSADMADVNKNAHDFWCGESGYCNTCSTKHTTKTVCEGHDGGCALGGHHQHNAWSSKDSPGCYGTTGLICGKTQHKHTDSCKAPQAAVKGIKIDSTVGAPASQLICNKEEHTHSSSGCYRSTGVAVNCPSTYHVEEPWVNAANPGCHSKNYTNDYCRHGFSGGQHTCKIDNVHGGCTNAWGEAHIGNCYGPPGVGTKCSHNHRNCLVFSWKCVTYQPNVPSQDCEYVTKTDVYDNFEECYLTEIPLVTKVEVNKYIYDVRHNTESETPGGIDTTYIASDERKELDEATKEANPVYVEVDDYVIFKIAFTNSSAFDVYIRADDVMPEADAYEFVEAYVGEEKKETLPDLRESRIQINAYSESVISVTLKVKAIKGEYENLAKIITRNGPDKDPDSDDVDYIRTVDDNGPIVNHIQNESNGTTQEPKWESSDFFIVNNYNVHMDKYVHEYDELMLKENNSNSFTDEDSITKEDSNELEITRENISETTVKVSDGNVEDTVRFDDGEHEKHKREHPVNAEKKETLIYAIKVTNEAMKVEKDVSSGSKPATQVIPTRIEDKLHHGLSYKSIEAIIYNPDGSEKRYILDDAVTCEKIGSNSDENIYQIDSDDSIILNPGEYIIYYIEVKIVQSNMYLYDMPNTAQLTEIENINLVKSAYNSLTDKTEELLTRNISKQQISSEHIRMKDLVISGKVWLDIDKDGLMNDTSRGSLDERNNDINSNAMKKDIIVKLYRVDGEDNSILYRTTKTDGDGLYSFGRKKDLEWYETFNNNVNYSATTEYQRIDKANKKDEYGNYSDSSTYYKYYVEFVYDGVVYKSTDVYAGMKNLNTNDGRFTKEYLIDSNATEIIKDREAFNTRYEYISYDIAYNLDLNHSGDLVFQKDGHGSYLIEDHSRAMNAKSFVIGYDTETVLKACKTAMNSCGSSKWKQCSNHWDDWQVAISLGIIDESQYSNTTAGRKKAQTDLKNKYETLKNNATEDGDTQLITYLWLYSFNDETDNTLPETDYLKYINLGLELREDVDLALTKDVYNLKTTINGEELEYDYNLGDTDKYLNDYIVKKPYKFEIYESDYKYRVEQYISHVVETYKGLLEDEEVRKNQKFGTDELNIEVTYRINLKNIATTDDDSIANAGDTPLAVKVHEVLDLYDHNFVKYADDTVTTKIKNAEGLLVDKQINIVEAWMFMTNDEAKGKVLLEGGQKYSQRTTAGSKPIYVMDNNGDYVKVKLELSEISSRGAKGAFSNKGNNFIADGYNTLYIRGMGEQVLYEGEDLDIYVKYIVDKESLEIEVAENYDETQTVSKELYNPESKKTEVIKLENDNIHTAMEEVKTETTDGETVKKTILHRSIKLAEKIESVFKDSYGRGTENIAQIDAYSVWYTDGKPASLVDKDSNAGNIGVKNTSDEDISAKDEEYSEEITSADDVDFYEDMTYKTGIQLMIEENLIGDDDDDDDDDDLRRKIKGTVWDDSRTDTLGTGKETQYIADGKFDTSKTKQKDAQANKNVEINYKPDENITEEIDIAVRSAKAEFVEIVKVPIIEDGVVKEIRYYEEILTDVTWEQVQNDRTNTNGKYTLEGFKPGTYIVRFTYGDYIDIPEDLSGLSEMQKDMLIFNGQDYKSTQYTGVAENIVGVDEVIDAFEKAGVSDARDDEFRRLQVNAYSEVMTNPKAEILKGVANGTELTPNSKTNTAGELKALTDNTYMTADTLEFEVKTEKLKGSQIQKYTTKNIYYQELESLMNPHIPERDFIINNVDFGIEYRPESQISLMKEIDEVKLITEDNEVLVDLFFDSVGDGSERKHSINNEKSTGEELVQFITNNYENNALINSIIPEEYVQGLVYIQVDQEILQGCTVQITYKFEAQNCSEVDRISKKLDAIRYKNNQATEELFDAYSKTIKPETLLELSEVMKNKNNYTASEMASYIVYADTYKKDTEQLELDYKQKLKRLTTSGDDGYYGRYVGYGYYTGKESTLDTISNLKFDMIIDYIDTNLEFEQKTATEQLENRLWNKITINELVNIAYKHRVLDNVGTKIQDILGNADKISQTKVTDINGKEYHSMVISVDDRIKDDKYSSDKPEFSTIDNDAVKNNDISRFLVPKVTVVGLEGTDKDAENIDKLDEYTGTIYLDTSKVLAAGTKEDDMTYENMAEIVEFTTQTGRRTNFATTIGNADIHEIKRKIEEKEPPFNPPNGNNAGSIEFMTASLEPDTSVTETVTLIPPTGLMKSRRPIVSLMEGTKTGVEVISIVGLVVAGITICVVIVLFVMKKYKKRRIK